MSRVLTSTPSAGVSEVLRALHEETGAGRRPMPTARFIRALAQRYGGQAQDSDFSDDALSVLSDLVDDDLVVGGTSLDDTVQLTDAGRLAARAPRPRPRNIRG